jgi:nucleotide-binding universal stress UspA family protein
MSTRDIVIPLVALAVGAAATALLMRRRRASAEPPAPRAKILFPFVGTELSERALQAAIRIARAQNALIVAGYLATVPQRLPLDVPLGRSCDEAFSVFEAIEQRAARFGVPVDGRIARGRNVRHALRNLMTDVPTARRIVVAASNGHRHDGFGVDDIAWLLHNARGEVLVVRPDPEAGDDAVEPPVAAPLVRAGAAA